MSSQHAESHAGGHQAGAAHGSSAHDIQAHVRVYMMVFGALAVLTVVTVAVSYLHMPVVPAIAAALAIASVKASLVALYFMHLKGEVRAIVWTLMLTAIFFLTVMTIPVSWYMDGPAHGAGGVPAARPPATHEAH